MRGGMGKRGGVGPEEADPALQRPANQRPFRERRMTHPVSASQAPGPPSWVQGAPQPSTSGSSKDESQTKSSKSAELSQLSPQGFIRLDFPQMLRKVFS